MVAYTLVHNQISPSLKERL